MERKWTYRDIDTLRREFPLRKTEEVAAMLKRSVTATSVMASKLGLKKKHLGIVWTPQMVKLVKDFFPIMFNKPLAAWVGVSQRSLIRKARELGIEKRPGFLEDRRGDINQLVSEALKKTYSDGKHKGTFQKGVRSNPAGEFKKGHKESPETKAKRRESLKRAWAQRRRKEEMKHYGIGV